MNWLVWRQHRWDGASALAVLLFLGGAMIILTAVSANLLAEISRTCATQSSDCGTLRGDYHSTFGQFQTVINIAGVVIPALLGVFVGAPMVARELELGTHLLVWAQGITRRRWFFSKVILLTTATLVSSGGLGAIYLVWLTPQQSVADLWYSFDVEPLALVSYSIFALMLGIAFGVIIQRTLPAMAATLVTFIGVRALVELLARPRYLPPLSWDIGSNIQGDSSFLFVGSAVHTDLAGHAISEGHWNEVLQQCSSLPVQTEKTAGPPPLHECLLNHGVLVVQQYQPESRFWLFQGIEAAIFIALALLIVAVAYRLIARKS
jgi:ABC-type transport system involved in multi-copper enzyme maturation permease subunit